MENKIVYYKETVECGHTVFDQEVLRGEGGGGSTTTMHNQSLIGVFQPAGSSCVAQA
jgi:hypothetical protein